MLVRYEIEKMLIEEDLEVEKLPQICCAPAGKNVAQIFRGASPPLYCHRESRKDFSIAALQIVAVQLAISRNQATDVHIVKICFDFPCGHSSVVPEVVRRWTPNILNLADFRTPVHKELVLIAADRQRFYKSRRNHIVRDFFQCSGVDFRSCCTLIGREFLPEIPLNAQH